MRVASVLLGFCMLVLAACGGGGGGGGGGSSNGGSGGTIPNQAPVASIALNGPVYATGLAALDGSGSSDPEGKALSYFWTLASRPDGSAAFILNNTAAKPLLRADLTGTYRVTLTVSDGALSSNPVAQEFAVTLNSEDGQRAAASSLIGVAERTTSSHILRWVDGFDSYKIEVKDSNGVFGLIDTVVGTGDGVSVVEWRRSMSGEPTFRVIGQRQDRERVLHGRNGYSTLTLKPAIDVQINVDQPSIITGLASLTLAPVSASPRVHWLLNNERLPMRTTDTPAVRSGNPYPWQSGEMPDGSHRLHALIDRQDDTYSELSVQISTANAGIGLSAELNEQNGTKEITAVATSAAGVVKVEAILVGQVTQTLTAPNACISACMAPAKNAYRFSYNTNQLSPGSYSVTIRATDASGATTERIVSFFARRAPVLTVSQPANAYVKNPLHLAGTVVTDASNVTVTAHIDSIKVFETTSLSFNSMINLPSSLNPGPFTMTVKVTDSEGGAAVQQRRIYLLPASGTIPAPIGTLDYGGWLEYVDGDLAPR